jgi:hypothetical protein
MYSDVITDLSIRRLRRCLWASISLVDDHVIDIVYVQVNEAINLEIDRHASVIINPGRNV